MPKKSFELRVGAQSEPGRLAGALVKFQDENCDVVLVSIGAGAVNQAAKAVAIARTMVSGRGLEILVQMSFEDREIDGAHRTALKMHVYRPTIETFRGMLQEAT